MGSRLHVCVTQEYWLWLLCLPLIKGFVSLLSLEELKAASSLDLSLESHSLKYLMIFTIIKGKFILSLENFSRSIWGSLIKANERKTVCVCVCVCVCVNFPFCCDLLTISFKSLLTNTHLILNY